MEVVKTNIAIIDADLIGRKRHRFPNLACMKMSGYWKSKGDSVVLKTDLKGLRQFDKVFISKVFTDTPIDESVLDLSNVEYGGTGFYFDKASNLPDEIEHHMPDYDLYGEWVQAEMDRGVDLKQFDDYLKSSIGFTTRGCFRKCPFCVNKKYNTAFKHSKVLEFLDTSKPRISLWDDNFLAYPRWREILADLKATKKQFQFRQGLDLRLMTEEKALLFKDAKYFGDYIFAFDHIGDREIIEDKLKIWKKHIKKTTKLYVFCGFDREDKWNQEFWEQDIADTFERIKILMKYGALPYIMRFNRYEESPYRGMYINLARWCNQPSFYKKKSFREFCEINGENSSTMKYLNEFELEHPSVAAMYFDLKYEQLNTYLKNIEVAI